MRQLHKIIDQYPTGYRDHKVCQFNVVIIQNLNYNRRDPGDQRKPAEPELLPARKTMVHKLRRIEVGFKRLDEVAGLKFVKYGPGTDYVIGSDVPVERESSGQCR